LETIQGVDLSWDFVTFLQLFLLPGLFARFCLAGSQPAADVWMHLVGEHDGIREAVTGTPRRAAQRVI
jgi:hypothetical protein